MCVEFLESCPLSQRYQPRSFGTVTKAFSLFFGALLMAGSLSAATSPTGDVVGKLTVGYQGWFACTGDGSPENRWMHWGQGNGNVPDSGKVHFDLYPDVREYPTTYQTALGNLGNGSNAKLFSSYDASVVNKHLEWMRDYGIDTVALQRFGSSLGDSRAKNQKNGIATMVKNAAQTYGRKFYIMYDLSDWTQFQTEIKTDWSNTIRGSLGLLNSSAYAKQNGKPVVCIWGVGKDVGNATSWTDVINWFKGQGCYVIIGVPRKWRTDDASSSYQHANMISPWTIGAYMTDADIDAHGLRMKDDKTLCDSRSQDYQPVVYPGFSWANWKINEDGSRPARNSTPRRHGDFMWRQFYQVRNQNIPSVYVAMFDEYDEGTAIAKAAEDTSMIPVDQWFLTLDYDGVRCSSDFYLRLTGDGAKMVKGITGKVTTHPTSHTVSGGMPSVGAIITLKAVNGKYVSATYSTNNTLIANKTTVSNFERFKVINATNCIALQCVGTGKFVGINSPSGSKPMLANRPSIGSYEKFKLIQAESQIAICSVLTTNYASAISNGVAPLQASQSYVGAYEKFTWKVE